MRPVVTDPQSTLLVRVEVLGPRVIQVHVSFAGSPAYGSTTVRDAEAVMDRLELWLGRLPDSRYDVQVRGADGHCAADVLPNRYLALYYIATALKNACTRQTDGGRSAPLSIAPIDIAE